MMAAEAMQAAEEELDAMRRDNNPLFGNLADEFRRQTSPLPRQKKLHSDFAELPIDPRTQASQASVTQLISRYSPSVQQIKEAFNTIPQYAFQDIPEQPTHRTHQNRLSPPALGGASLRRSPGLPVGAAGLPEESDSNLSP